MDPDQLGVSVPLAPLRTACKDLIGHPPGAQPRHRAIPHQRLNNRVKALSSISNCHSSRP
jgi:hypothetical protein